MVHKTFFSDYKIIYCQKPGKYTRKKIKIFFVCVSILSGTASERCLNWSGSLKTIDACISNPTRVTRRKREIINVGVNGSKSSLAICDLKENLQTRLSKSRKSSTLHLGPTWVVLNVSFFVWLCF